MDLTWLEQLPADETVDLSVEARAGLECARFLKQKEQAGGLRSVRDLASSYAYDASTIRRWIRKAERELTQPPRTCVACDRQLPRGSRSSRLYCDEHAAPAARIRRHRESATNSHTLKGDTRPRPAPRTTSASGRSDRPEPRKTR